MYENLLMFTTDTMKNLQNAFLTWNTNNAAYSLFCKLQPFWVVHPTLSDHNTSLYKMHENLIFIVKELHYLRLIDISDVRNLTEIITCHTSNEMCMNDEYEKRQDSPVVIALQRLKSLNGPQQRKKGRMWGRDLHITYLWLITVKKTRELYHTLLHKF